MKKIFALISLLIFFFLISCSEITNITSTTSPTTQTTSEMTTSVTVTETSSEEPSTTTVATTVSTTTETTTVYDPGIYVGYASGFEYIAENNYYVNANLKDDFITIFNEIDYNPMLGEVSVNLYIDDPYYRNATYYVYLYNFDTNTRLDTIMFSLESQELEQTLKLYGVNSSDQYRITVSKSDDDTFEMFQERVLNAHLYFKDTNYDLRTKMTNRHITQVNADCAIYPNTANISFDAYFNFNASTIYSARAEVYVAYTNEYVKSVDITPGFITYNSGNYMIDDVVIDGLSPEVLYEIVLTVFGDDGVDSLMYVPVKSVILRSSNLAGLTSATNTEHGLYGIITSTYYFGDYVRINYFYENTGRVVNPETNEPYTIVMAIYDTDRNLVMTFDLDDPLGFVQFEKSEIDFGYLFTLSTSTLDRTLAWSNFIYEKPDFRGSIYLDGKIQFTIAQSTDLLVSLNIEVYKQGSDEIILNLENVSFQTGFNEILCNLDLNPFDTYIIKYTYIYNTPLGENNGGISTYLQH